MGGARYTRNSHSLCLIIHRIFQRFDRFRILARCTVVVTRTGRTRPRRRSSEVSQSIAYVDTLWSIRRDFANVAAYFIILATFAPLSAPPSIAAPAG